MQCKAAQCNVIIISMILSRTVEQEILFLHCHSGISLTCQLRIFLNAKIKTLVLKRFKNPQRIVVPFVDNHPTLAWYWALFRLTDSILYFSKSGQWPQIFCFVRFEVSPLLWDYCKARWIFVTSDCVIEYIPSGWRPVRNTEKTYN